jgi:hypothetical protein
VGGAGLGESLAQLRLSLPLTPTEYFPGSNSKKPLPCGKGSLIFASGS